MEMNFASNGAAQDVHRTEIYEAGPQRSNSEIICGYRKRPTVARTMEAGRYNMERVNAICGMVSKSTCCADCIHLPHPSVPRAGGFVVAQLEPAAWKESPAELSAWSDMFENLCMDDLL